MTNIFHKSLKAWRRTFISLFPYLFYDSQEPLIEQLLCARLFKIGKTVIFRKITVIQSDTR